MIYKDKTVVLIPYIKDDNTPDWMRITIDAKSKGIKETDLLRGVRIFIKKTFGKQVSNVFIKRSCLIINQHDNTKIVSKEDNQNFMDNLVLALQEEEDKYALENGGYTEDQSPASEETELAVSSL